LITDKHGGARVHNVELARHTGGLEARRGLAPSQIAAYVHVAVHACPALMIAIDMLSLDNGPSNRS
jgi:hypothetical protein